MIKHHKKPSRTQIITSGFAKIDYFSTQYSSLLPTLLPPQAWKKLESSNANRSNTRKLDLLDSLTNISLADKSISEYMQGIKNILDNLELIGYSVDDGAVVIHILNGLGPKYLPLASVIRARDSPISFEELYNKLLDYESFLKRD
ncbi:hypothetical protein Ddye_013226 [Dipteronia dyeriana]|uniref:Uncharacterized protein n=1 Tax=Dipteronia dyeriana TaxID=168575 RepID=A0AAD9X5S0_9ROSI|nr:hypothetical protein Ddye_013226 [Dipteronia dyeriana]